ncbi:putative F-box/LRR-repeat protein At1g56400 [Pyrus x bretschneideri]|uniref:putative F-box/LRR-repeat protein At1g56400 n=1 Tax=Pyrus x bretschneideri TaxID=225117 RepID=UPI0020302044|nr:putative F-box/LRR-repeat protein At1g56400 [Pyrus x bretschneideri]XP_048419993.1 putative F-box/LRR-repeat protein At1g56400 [Pyrus x bretschneideri]
MDKFSQLPEPLLLIIIANLPFKEAARNSILSKLWRRLGRSTQIVEFNERFFVNTDAAPADRAIQRLTFIDFVRHWIDNSPKTPVGKVALTFSETENFQQFVLDCIQFCVKHVVKQLALDFSDPAWDELGYDYHESYFDLPLDVYNHRVLESLALFSCNFDADLVGNFHLLKHISLGWIALPVSLQETLLAQSRLLESLSLKKCWGMNSLDVRGNDLKLKTLVVDRCSIHYPHSFYLEAPKLNYLKFVGGDVPALTTGEGSEFNFFEELDLDLSPVIDFHGSASPNSILDILPRSLVIDFHSFASPNSILDILPPSRKLTVCSYILRAIINHTEQEPIIPSPHLTVTDLTLKTTMHHHEQLGIKFFLNCCPHLETLTIKRCPEEIYEYYVTPVLKPQEMWKGTVEVYECITRTLRMVEVKDYMGSQHELDLLSYLLTHGRIVE